MLYVQLKELIVSHWRSTAEAMLSAGRHAPWVIIRLEASSTADKPWKTRRARGASFLAAALAANFESGIRIA